MMKMNIMKKLYHGKLLNEENSDYLTDLLKRQMFRSGTPAGSAPSQVANKIGFVYAWTNDTAIVYSPSGDYVLTIMTNNSGWHSINDLASRIHNLMN